MASSLPREPLELRAFLPYRLALLAQRSSRGLAARYARRFDISIPEWRCLAVLDRERGLSAGDLAERTSLDKVQTSRAIARLAERGLLERRPDPSDRRTVRLTLTAAGHRLFADVAEVARAWERDLTQALGLSDRRALDRVLVKLARALDALEAADGLSSDAGPDA